MIRNKAILVVAALAVLASVSFGQGRRGGGFGPQGPIQLAGREDVQADLKITDDQKTKISDLVQQYRDASREKFQAAAGDRTQFAKIAEELNAEYLPKLNDILTPDQQKRIKQIQIQLMKNSAVNLPDVSAALGITDDQKSKIADLVKTQQEANAAIFQKIQSGEMDRSEAGPAMRKNQDTLNDEIGKLLTDDQKSKLKDMSGAPFTPAPPPGQ